jgi:hypothetical protein
MSSETSIESSVVADRSVGLQPDPALEPWQLFTLAGLIGATIVVFVSTGQTPAGIILLSLTIFTAAVVGVAAWRTLSPLIGGDERGGAPVLGGRTRAALEREKTLVLRSIKELEFDHAMGKVSDTDFAEMSARLRSRAAGLIKQLDAGSSYREQIEKEIQKRVAQPTAGRASSGSSGGSQRVRTVRVCASCNTQNDSDAKFCKGCGLKLEAAS